MVRDISNGNFKVLLTGDFVPPQTDDSAVSFKSLFSDIIPTIREHSFVVANLECPLTTSGAPIRKNGPVIFSAPMFAEEMSSLGINVATLANNHIMDMGGRGLKDTLFALRNAGIKYVGAGDSLLEASKPLYITKGDVKLSILSFAEHEFSIAGDQSAGACPIDPIKNYKQIKEAKKNSEILIITLHGGNEYYSLPSPRVVELCHFYAEIGADAIVCHHAHVPSGYEKFKGVPIYYSLGNFFFQWPTPKIKAWYFGHFVSLEIEKSKIKDTSIISYSQNRDKKGVWLLTETDKKEYTEQIDEFSKQITDPEMLQKKWKEFCASRKNNYLNMLTSHNRLESALRSRGIIPTRENSDYYFRLFNLISCEAHREVIITILENSIKRQS